MMIKHPFTKQTADPESVDSLWKLLSQVKDQLQALKLVDMELRGAIADHCKGDAKTQRVVGDDVTLKVTRPSDYWSQTVLKQLVEEDPEQSKIYLRVSTYSPNLREVKKLEEAYGNERFEKYKARLLGARSPSAYPPSVTLDEGK